MHIRPFGEKCVRTVRPIRGMKVAILAFERTLGYDHPNSNRVRCNLARLLLRTGNIEEGLSLAQIALAAHDECIFEQGQRGIKFIEPAQHLGKIVDAVRRIGLILEFIRIANSFSCQIGDRRAGLLRFDWIGEERAVTQLMPVRLECLWIASGGFKGTRQISTLQR